MIEQKCNALQKDRCLSASCNAIHQQHRNIRVPDDRILLLLDGNGNGLHLVTVLTGQRGNQHRILNGQLRVKIRFQRILLQVKLAPELKIHRNRPSIHFIGSAPVLLVIIGFRNGRAPVHDQLIVSVFRDGTAADVVILRLLLRIKLELHPRKIRCLQQHVDLCKLLRHRAGLDVIGINVAVPGLDLTVALGLHLIIRRVITDIGQNIRLLLHGLLVQLRNAFLQLLLHLLKLRICCMQVFLLLLKNILIHTRILFLSVTEYGTLILYRNWAVFFNRFANHVAGGHVNCYCTHAG